MGEVVWEVKTTWKKMEMSDHPILVHNNSGGGKDTESRRATPCEQVEDWQTTR